MSVPAPEFSRTIRIDAALKHSGPAKIVANAMECADLARRFGLLAIDRLEADYELGEDNGRIFLTGTLRAHVDQKCIATGEPVPEHIDTLFRLLCLADTDDSQEEETELDEEDCDTVFYAADTLDVGEAVAQTLALSLAPYPRSPDADAFLRANGVISEDEVGGPLAGLKALLQDKNQR